MYLKSLILKGFKSFADRSVLSLEPGITAVVVPTAPASRTYLMPCCGCSASATPKTCAAKRWRTSSSRALQRGKALVSPRLILCSTTRTARCRWIIPKSPLRDACIARARASILSTDRRHVAWTFSTFCTILVWARERIPSLARATLTLFCNRSRMSRRSLIEEAAGVLKHKQRKAKSARKLERMNQHLARVKDVAAEVERQLGPLARKAKRAKTYQELTEQLSSMTVSLAVDDLRTLQKTWEDTLAREKCP